MKKYTAKKATVKIRLTKQASDVMNKAARYNKHIIQLLNANNKLMRKILVKGITS